MTNQEQLQVLQQIRDLQKQQTEMLAEMLQAQREHITLYRDHIDRVDRINTRAEAIQDKSAQLMGVARKGISGILVVVIILIAYLSWILFR